MWKYFKEAIAKHLKEVFQKCVRKDILQEIEMGNYASTSYYILIAT